MKTCFLILITVLFLPGPGQVQAQSPTKGLNPATMKAGYAMHQGRMIRIQGGQLLPLSREVRLENGTRIFRNGMVALPGKSRQKLAEGYAVNLDGKIVLLQDDMMRYEAIREHSRKTVGHTDSEVLITDNGIAVAGTGEKKSTNEQLLNRRMVLIQQRNILIKQKADLLNKAVDRKAQQTSPAIREADEKLYQLNRQLKELEQQLRQLYAMGKPFLKQKAAAIGGLLPLLLGRYRCRSLLLFLFSFFFAPMQPNPAAQAPDFSRVAGSEK